MLRVHRPRQLSLPAGTDHLVLPLNPQRVFAIVFRGIGANVSGLRPGAGMTGDGILPETGQTHTLIHRSSYPGLAQGEWRCDAVALSDLWIAEVDELPNEEE